MPSRSSSGLGETHLRNWTPVYVDLEGGPQAVTWLNLNQTAFTDPFFADTVDRHRRLHPRAETKTTPLATLAAVGEAITSLPLTGFILHMSRCGSTLLANMLRSLPRNLVIGEAQPVSELLYGAACGLLGMQGTRLLRTVVRVLGQPRHGAERHYFVKFTSWSTLYVSYLTRIFDRVPWLFLVRVPVDVMISNLQRPGAWMQAQSNSGEAAELAGVDFEAVSIMSAEEYCARILGRFCKAAADAAPMHRLVLDYSELTADRLPEVLAFFGVSTTSEEALGMTAALLYEAKDATGTRPFRPRAVDRYKASTQVIELAERWIYEPYTRLLRDREVILALPTRGGPPRGRPPQTRGRPGKST